MSFLRVAASLLAGAVLVSAAIPLKLNTPYTGSLAFLGDEEHFTYDIPTANAEQGLIIKAAWPKGNVHIYVRCDARPGLGSGSYWQRSTVPVEATSNDLYLPDVRSCISPKTLHIVAYGFRKTSTYVITASHSTTEIRPHAKVVTPALKAGEWVYYQAELSMVSRLMVSAQLASPNNNHGVYVYYKQGALPSGNSYDKRFNVYKTSAVRCVDTATPADGLYYFGVQGELNLATVTLQVNINPLGACRFVDHNPGTSPVVIPDFAAASQQIRRLSADEVNALRALE